MGLTALRGGHVRGKSLEALPGFEAFTGDQAISGP